MDALFRGVQSGQAQGCVLTAGAQCTGTRHKSLLVSGSQKSCMCENLLLIGGHTIYK